MKFSFNSLHYPLLVKPLFEGSSIGIRNDSLVRTRQDMRERVCWLLDRYPAIDADAFRAFEETGLFNQDTADSFRRNILAKGGSEDPAELYRGFRGADPSIDALLERKGFAR